MATDFLSTVKNVGMLVLGAIILVIHVLIYKANQYMFTVVMCLYILGYTVLVIVLMYKNKGCYRQEDMSVLLNMSVYTVFLEIFLILLSFWFMFNGGYRHY
jgi:RsiW-degrading membrane proteinase PrsW (M82 family)